jgi:hypothetical protein
VKSLYLSFYCLINYGGSIILRFLSELTPIATEVGPLGVPTAREMSNDLVTCLLFVLRDCYSPLTVAGCWYCDVLKESGGALPNFLTLTVVVVVVLSYNLKVSKSKFDPKRLQSLTCYSICYNFSNKESTSRSAC